MIKCLVMFLLPVSCYSCELCIKELLISQNSIRWQLLDSEDMDDDKQYFTHIYFAGYSMALTKALDIVRENH